MHWIQAWDVAVFHWVNGTLANPYLDVVMRYASGNPVFFPALFVAAAVLLCKGKIRGRLCVLMLAAILPLGDSLVCNTVKHAIARPRPFVALPNVREPGNKVSEYRTDPSQVTPAMFNANRNSMPSSHASNWFAGTMVLLVYYRRSWRFMLPLALLVSISRVYNGVHYPTDVLAGAIVGAGYAAAGLWALNMGWQWAGPKWFPLWWGELPSLVEPEFRILNPESRSREPQIQNQEPKIENEETHWVRLGYLVIAVLFLGNLIYLASGRIELSGDEAYQWTWSKHPALSYYSKPPLIAYTQWLGTHIFGDTEFGVRFFSPVIGGVIAAMLLRFFAREVSARAGFILMLIISTCPLLALGSILMTVDPLLVLFWTAAMMAGWRAVRPEGTTASWLWMGLWMGLGLLSKYTELLQLLAWAVFFIAWKPARVHLRRPGPYLAILIQLACAIPVFLWNSRHGWITLSHVAENASLDSPWRPTLRYCFDFLGSEAALWNPVYFVAAAWAAIALWRRNRHDPRLVYFFSMGAPLFLCYFAYSFHSRILQNWIAPSVIPMLCMAVIYWDTRWRLGARRLGWVFTGGLVFGIAAVTLMHDTDLIGKVVGRPFPPKIDPLTRVRGYAETARVVDGARSKLAAEGKPVFVIGEHYQITGLLSFYIPDARTNIVDHPLVYCHLTDVPQNQYFFWPRYGDQRQGQNAIFVRELSMPPLVKGWFFRSLRGDPNLQLHPPELFPAPASLVKEFDSVTDLGLYNVVYRDRVFHVLQLFECRNLK